MPSLFDRFKGSLLGRIATERELLGEDSGVYVEGRRVYNVSRSVVAELASHYLDQILAYEQSPQILEVGGGEGNAILEFIQSGKVAPKNLV